MRLSAVIYAQPVSNSCCLLGSMVYFSRCQAVLDKKLPRQLAGQLNRTLLQGTYCYVPTLFCLVVSEQFQINLHVNSVKIIKAPILDPTRNSTRLELNLRTCYQPTTSTHMHQLASYVHSKYTDTRSHRQKEGKKKVDLVSTSQKKQDCNFKEHT